MHGFDRLEARLADHYLIYGAETMGLLLAQLARRAGAASVDLVDVKHGRLPVALRLAADRVVSSADGTGPPGGLGGRD